MKKIAILIENQYDAKELLYPYYRMQEEGYEVDLIGTKAKTTYTSKNGVPLESDFASQDVTADDYAGLIIPANVDCRHMPSDVRFVQNVIMNECCRMNHFYDSSKYFVFAANAATCFRCQKTKNRTETFASEPTRVLIDVSNVRICRS